MLLIKLYYSYNYRHLNISLVNKRLCLTQSMPSIPGAERVHTEVLTTGMIVISLERNLHQQGHRPRGCKLPIMKTKTIFYTFDACFVYELRS